MPAPNNLSEKQRKLVVAHLNGLNKKNALAEAGYSPLSDAFESQSVIQEIKRRQHSMSTKAGVTADWIIDRLKLIADANVYDMLKLHGDGTGHIDLDKITPALKTALTNFETETFGDVTKIKIKLSDKLRALEMLARHLGLFNDKMELSGELSLEERLQAGRQRAFNEEKID